MRILHVLDHSIPLHSGYTFRTRAILEQQRAMGWDTFHITSPKHNLVATTSADEEDVDGLHFYRTPLSSSLFSKLPILNQWYIIAALKKRLDAVVQQLKPDIIHAHSPSLNGKAALAIGKKYGIPVVYEIRAFWEDAAVDHGTSREWGLRYRATRMLETDVIRRASAVTTICEGLKNDIVARGVGSDKVTVIPNAVDISRFNEATQPDAALAKKLGLEGKHVLGFIGSFYAYEGLALLLQSLPDLLSRRNDIHVLLVGGGPQEQRLKEIADNLSVTGHVTFAGRVPHEQVQAYYDLVDILVYPRLSMRLTELVTPLKPLEAMAQRRLVVASDVGGHKELIRDGSTGILFRAGDPRALADAVAGLLERKEQWDSLKDQGRAYVEQERNWRVSVSRYRDVYQYASDAADR